MGGVIAVFGDRGALAMTLITVGVVAGVATLLLALAEAQAKRRAAERVLGQEPDLPGEPPADPPVSQPANPLGALLWALFCSLLAGVLLLVSGDPRDELASAFDDLKAEVGLSDAPAGKRPASSVEAQPTAGPPPTTELGGEHAAFHEPTCGALADGVGSGGAPSRLTVMDMAIAGRRIRQPPDAYPIGLPFVKVVRIRPFEVVQVSVIVMNAGPRAVAKNVRLSLVFPTHPATAMSITASAQAANARPTDSHRTGGVVSLLSMNGRPFRLENFRSVQVQHNERERDFHWGRFETYPTCALESKRSERTFEVKVPAPSIDGTLGVDDAYRISMLADVSPGWEQ